MQSVLGKLPVRGELVVKNAIDNEAANYVLRDALSGTHASADHEDLIAKTHMASKVGPTASHSRLYACPEVWVVKRAAHAGIGTGRDKDVAGHTTPRETQRTVFFNSILKSAIGSHAVEDLGLSEIYI